MLIDNANCNSSISFYPVLSSPFTFDTLTDKYEYEIIAVFKTVVYTDSPESFKYYQFVNAEEPSEFKAYVDECKKLSLYDTDFPSSIDAIVAFSL